jgi:tetratricopeptide (TPR) repeat protein
MIRWNEWANAYASFGYYEEALERNDRAYALIPVDPFVLSTRGTILQGLGRIEEALAAYDASLLAQPMEDRAGRKIVWNEKGILFQESGRYAEADAAYDEALQLMPDAAATWDNRARNQGLWGTAEVAAGRHDTARQHFAQGLAYAKQAVQLGYQRPDLTRLQALLQRQLSDISDA